MFNSAGLLQQWLIEGKFTEEEALSQSYDMLSAGVDTVSNFLQLACYLIDQSTEQKILAMFIPQLICMLLYFSVD
jgi:cytochrome P450